MATKLPKLTIFCSIFLGIFAQDISFINVAPEKCSLNVGENVFEADDAKFACADQLKVIEAGLSGTLDLSNSNHSDCWCYLLFRYHLQCDQISIETASRCLKPHLTISALIDISPFQTSLFPCLYIRSPEPEKPKNFSVEVASNLLVTCAELRDASYGLKNEVFFQDLANPGCLIDSTHQYERGLSKRLCGLHPIVDRFCIPVGTDIIAGCLISLKTLDLQKPLEQQLNETKEALGTSETLRGQLVVGLIVGWVIAVLVCMAAIRCAIEFYAQRP